MEHVRKRIMRCKHPTPCELCLTDCKRAEITAKEDTIRSDLLMACRRVRQWLNEEHKEYLTKADCEQILFTVLAKATG